tara:strand:+ start:2544 stop:3929 length:1386 start_codon:yes stop_codon:yes gene_type:complete
MPGSSEENLSLKPYRFGFLFSFFNSTTWIVVLGTPAVLFAESLGASTFEVGLLYSFVFLLLPLQVMATATLPKFGYKAQVFFAWTTRSVFLFIPLVIAIRGQPIDENTSAVSWLLMAMFCFCIFRSIGTCAIQPWLFDLLPEKLQARYFSTDMAIINVGGVIALVFCSLTFRWLSTFEAFSAQYSFALAGALLCLLGIVKLPSVPKPPSFGPLRIIKEGHKLLVRRGNFRHYLILSLIWVVSGSAVIPFSIYYLKAVLEINETYILLFTAVQCLGGITGALIMKNRMDRLGIRRSFLIVMFINLFIYLSWIILISSGMSYPNLTIYLIYLLPLTYFGIGSAGAIYFSAHLKYLAFVSENRERALKVSLHAAVVGLSAGIASIIWGLVFKSSGDVPSMNLTAFMSYFALIAILQIALTPYIRSLKEPDPSVKPLTNSYGIIRPWRFIATFPVLRRRKNKSNQ